MGPLTRVQTSDVFIFMHQGVQGNAQRNKEERSRDCRYSLSNWKEELLAFIHSPACGVYMWYREVLLVDICKTAKTVHLLMIVSLLWRTFSIRAENENNSQAPTVDVSISIWLYFALVIAYCIALLSLLSRDGIMMDLMCISITIYCLFEKIPVYRLILWHRSHRMLILGFSSRYQSLSSFVWLPSLKKGILNRLNVEYL